MPTTSKPRPTRPSAFQKPEKKHKTRRCDNCGDLYIARRQDQRFCTHNNGACRKQFHKFGAAFGPLKDGLERAIEMKYAELRREVLLQGPQKLTLEKEVKHLAFMVGGLLERVEKLES